MGVSGLVKFCAFSKVNVNLVKKEQHTARTIWKTDDINVFCGGSEIALFVHLWRRCRIFASYPFSPVSSPALLFKPGSCVFKSRKPRAPWRFPLMYHRQSLNCRPQTHIQYLDATDTNTIGREYLSTSQSWENLKTPKIEFRISGLKLQLFG